MARNVFTAEEPTHKWLREGTPTQAATAPGLATSCSGNSLRLLSFWIPFCFLLGHIDNDPAHLAT